MNLAEVKKLKVAELKAQLQQRGLDTKGLKADLVQRLTAALEAEARDDVPGEPEDEAGPRDEVELLTGEPEERPVGEIEASPTVVEALGVFSEVGQGDNAEHAVQADDADLGEDDGVSVSTSENGSLSNEARCKADAELPEEDAEEEAVNGGDTRKESAAAPAAEWSVLAEKGSDSETEAEPAVDLQQEEDEEEQSTAAPDGKVCGAEKQDEHQQQAAEERRAVKRPFCERGRGYFEFKEEVNYNRIKSPEPEVENEAEEEVDEDAVRLDKYNCDLHFDVSPDGSGGQPLLCDKFPFLWSGCRLTHGVSQGKVGFEAKFVKKLPVTELNSEDSHTHVLRVGWSVDNSSYCLGEVELSYSYDARGKKVTEGKEEDYGEPFSENDIIGCYADFSDSEVELSFHKNGTAAGVAFQLPLSVLSGRALYPHVLCRNCSVSVNLDPSGEPWQPVPGDFTLLHVLPAPLRERAPLPPRNKQDCEVLMMVGMPGAGKTHWAQKHMAENPEKRYNLLGTRKILSSMWCVPKPKFREQVLQQATQCLSELIRIAARRRRNYILDQANVYSSAQRRKLLRFGGFHRRAVVVFPSDEEWKQRLKLHQEDEGEEIPQTSLLKVKVSFYLPVRCEYLEEVLFPEMSRAETEQLLRTYKEEARRLLPSPPRRKKPRVWHNKPAANQHAHYGRERRGWGQGAWNRGGFNQPFGSQPYWGSQRREDFRPFDQFRQDRFYGHNYNPQQFRDYRPYGGQWSQPFQGHGNFGSRSYGHGGHRGYW